MSTFFGIVHVLARCRVGRDRIRRPTVWLWAAAVLSAGVNAAPAVMPPLPPIFPDSGGMGGMGVVPLPVRVGASGFEAQDGMNGAGDASGRRDAASAIGQPAAQADGSVGSVDGTGFDAQTYGAGRAPATGMPIDVDGGLGAGSSTGESPSTAPTAHTAPAAPAAANSLAPALEGPPVPLAPAMRLAGGAPGSRAALDRRRITLDLQQAPLPAVFDAFSRFTGQSVVLSARVQGATTLSVRDVPWRDAFDAVLDANGLAMAMRGDVIWVAPAAELAARERARFEAHARAADLEPLASRTFLLRYPHASDIARLLAGGAPM